MIKGIQHVAILTEDIDAAIAYYERFLECTVPPVVDLERPGLKWRTVMLPIGCGSGQFLQIIQPLEGPGRRELERGGEGTLFEIGFEVDDIEQLHGRLLNDDIKAGDLCEAPLEGKYFESKRGNRIFVLPRDKTRHTRIECVQVMERQ